MSFIIPKMNQGASEKKKMTSEMKIKVGEENWLKRKRREILRKGKNVS